MDFDLTMSLIGGTVKIQGPPQFANTTQSFYVDASYEIVDGDPQLQDGYTEVNVEFDASATGEISLEPTGAMRTVRMKTPGGIVDQRLAFVY